VVPEQHRKFIDDELALVREVWTRQGNTLAAMAVFIVEDKRIICELPAVHNDLTKNIVSIGLKDLVRNVMPDAVIMMTEAWIAPLDTSELMPKSHPKRREVIHVQIEFKTGEKYSGAAEITREGGKVNLGPWDIVISCELGGRFMDFYPPKRVH